MRNLRKLPQHLPGAALTEITLIALTLLLAYSNGANDNFKGVATLYGSAVLTYRQARWLSTGATIGGAVAAVALAEALLKTFSGRGLVPNAILSDPAFAASVALAAGATVALATRMGMPISTTHALVGGLIGAGIVAAGSELNLGAVMQQFVAPLLLGPVVAFFAAAALAAVQRRFWATPLLTTVGQTDEACACVSVPEAVMIPVSRISGTTPGNLVATMSVVTAVTAVTLGTTGGDCAPMVADGKSVVITPSRAVNAAHIVSGASVCFARGLNDAPKIAALLLVVKSVGGSLSITGVALAMALGGFLHSRRVAETLSYKIIALEPKGSFLANLCTAGLVIMASKYGLPLSTTHVSVGAISGLSVGGSKISSTTLRQILLAWVATLPCAAAIGLIAYALLSHLMH